MFAETKGIKHLVTAVVMFLHVDAWRMEIE
jgi:hypothetical protein